MNKVWYEVRLRNTVDWQTTLVANRPTEAEAVSFAMLYCRSWKDGRQVTVVRVHRADTEIQVWHGAAEGVSIFDGELSRQIVGVDRQALEQIASGTDTD